METQSRNVLEDPRISQGVEETKAKGSGSLHYHLKVTFYFKLEHDLYDLKSVLLL